MTQSMAWPASSPARASVSARSSGGKRPAGDGPAVAAVEIIDDEDTVAGLDQLFDGVGADIARPARDHDVHEKLLPERPLPNRVAKEPYISQ